MIKGKYSTSCLINAIPSKNSLNTRARFFMKYLRCKNFYFENNTIILLFILIADNEENRNFFKTKIL